MESNIDLIASYTQLVHFLNRNVEGNTALNSTHFESIMKNLGRNIYSRKTNQKVKLQTFFELPEKRCKNVDSFCKFLLTQEGKDIFEKGEIDYDTWGVVTAKLETEGTTSILRIRGNDLNQDFLIWNDLKLFFNQNLSRFTTEEGVSMLDMQLYKLECQGSNYIHILPFGMETNIPYKKVEIDDREIIVFSISDLK